MDILDQLKVLCGQVGVSVPPTPKPVVEPVLEPKLYEPNSDIKCFCPCDFRALPVEPGSVSLICTDIPWTGKWLPNASDFAKWCAMVLRPGGVMATWCGKKHVDELLPALSNYLRYEWMLCAPLYSNGPSSGTFFGSRWQLAVVYTSHGPPLHLSRATLDWCPGCRREKDLYDHQCSLAQMQYLVEEFSEEGDLVCDPCAGSFTTAEACWHTNRRFIGGDINPDCLRMARKRFAAILPPDNNGK